MIIFKTWAITGSSNILGMQFDHLVRRLVVVGDLPEGWEWDALLGLDGALDIIRLSPTDMGVGAVLTREQLPKSGWYHIQLRGTRGEEVRHTNVMTAFVPESLSGDAQWPTVPSEFTQMEVRLRELNRHPPIPGENGCWMLWDPDTGQYVDSEFPLPEGGSGGADGAVRYDKAQELSGGQKGQARDNIGALGASELSDAVNTALAQARESGEFDGAPGDDGLDGVGIWAVEQTTTSAEDGGVNVVTVIKTDGSTSTFEVRNGRKGNGGPAGADGKDGADGYSPVRGTDYWTADDQASIVADVLAALPTWSGGDY